MQKLKKQIDDERNKEKGEKIRKRKSGKRGWGRVEKKPLKKRGRKGEKVKGKRKK